jgi:hypothetical protein
MPSTGTGDDHENMNTRIVLKKQSPDEATEQYMQAFDTVSAYSDRYQLMPQAYLNMMMFDTKPALIHPHDSSYIHYIAAMYRRAAEIGMARMYYMIWFDEYDGDPRFVYVAEMTDKSFIYSYHICNVVWDITEKLDDHDYTFKDFNEMRSWASTQITALGNKGIDVIVYELICDKYIREYEIRNNDFLTRIEKMLNDQSDEQADN